MAMTYVSPSGCNMYELTNEEMVNNYFELRDVYNDLDFIMKTSFSALVKFSTLLDQKSTFSFLQKTRRTKKHNFELFCTEVKLLPGNQELICISNPVSKLEITTYRLNGILKENKFFDNNFQKFMALTKREKEILKLIGLGYSNKGISERLFISNNTIKTHRKHINQKLDAKHLSDLIRYANTYRLI
ncbi:MAG: LuxR C-terminal-related transcriptional regulator [Bacteroidetes bacterium]|nr:LuxR C-terminal-related transcriptional regulator [Bacteroidota bacterium]